MRLVGDISVHRGRVNPAKIGMFRSVGGSGVVIVCF